PASEGYRETQASFKSKILRYLSLISFWHDAEFVPVKFSRLSRRCRILKILRILKMSVGTCWTGRITNPQRIYLVNRTWLAARTNTLWFGHFPDVTVRFE